LLPTGEIGLLRLHRTGKFLPRNVELDPVSAVRVDPIHSWDLILTFLVLAEEAQHSAAAERLGISRQTLRRRIDRLETDLGVPLFVRSRQRVELTSAGAAVLANAQPIAEAMGQLVEQARRRPPDRPLSVGITTDVDAIWARRVEAWVHERQEPAVLGYRPADLSLRLVAREKIDLLLCADACDDRANSLVVGHEPAVAVFPESHPAATQSAIRTGDLGDLAVAVSDATSDANRRVLVEQLQGDSNHPFIVAPRVGTTAAGLLLAAQKRGAATAVLAGAIERQDTTGLAVLPMDPPYMVPITLLRRPGLPDKPFRDLADRLMSWQTSSPG
jgi:DNA-binding transcriptional LysR family regulator